MQRHVSGVAISGVARLVPAYVAARRNFRPKLTLVGHVGQMKGMKRSVGGGDENTVSRLVHRGTVGLEIFWRERFQDFAPAFPHVVADQLRLAPGVEHIRILSVPGYPPVILSDGKEILEKNAIAVV